MIAHAAHRPLARDGEKLVGSGSVDMKGGVVLSLGVLRALAARPRDYAEVALLLVCDEEWRTAPFAPHRALRGLGRVPVLRGRRAQRRRQEGVVVRRKAAGTLQVTRARPRRPLRLGPRPRAQRAARARRRRPGGRRRHDPDGPDHLTAVPTVMHAGDAFNVVPGAGEL